MPEIYGQQVEAKVGSYVVPELWRIGGRLMPSDWEPAQFRLPTGQAVVTSVAVNVTVTGRTMQRRQGSLYVRCQVEFVGDGEPSTFSGGWLLVE
jgi:hypothetical protein